MMDEYKTSNVPSAKEQIAILEEKQRVAIEQLENNIHKSETSSAEDNETKNKGKEKENPSSDNTHN